MSVYFWNVRVLDPACFKLPLTVAIVEKIEHWTQVDQSGEYNTNLHEELDSQEVEKMMDKVLAICLAFSGNLTFFNQYM